MNRPLTPRQIEVLGDLYRLKLRPNQCRFQDIASVRNNIASSAWATPYDFGGRNRSHHSQTAMQLARRGLLDRYNYGTDRLNYFAGKSKGACVYRITDKGVTLLRALGVAAAIDRVYKIMSNPDDNKVLP